MKHEDSLVGREGVSNSTEDQWGGKAVSDHSTSWTTLTFAYPDVTDLPEKALNIPQGYWGETRQTNQQPPPQMELIKFLQNKKWE